MISQTEPKTLVNLSTGHLPNRVVFDLARRALAGAPTIGFFGLFPGRVTDDERRQM